MTESFRLAAMSTADGFQSEQEKLGQVWTYLGLARDIAKPNDWFRARLGGRDIFVQNFGDQIRGFENRCAHRGYPLRNGERGNGPIVCGFHHWRYDETGLAFGIPKCEEYFGARPKQMGLRLGEVEIDCCGDLIFGRFPGADGPSLHDWLGELYPLLERTGALTIKPSNFSRETASHWLLNMEISLDDYHFVAVHPETFGRGGYLAPEGVQYFRYGAHSQYMLKPPETEVDPTAAFDEFHARSGGAYRIFQLFPNLLVMQMTAISLAGEAFGYVLLQSFSALGHDRTRATTRHAALLPAGRPSLPRRLLQPFVDIGFRWNLGRVHDQDFRVTAALQGNAARLPSGPLATTEERIGWFREEYDRYTAGGAGGEDRSAD